MKELLQQVEDLKANLIEGKLPDKDGRYDVEVEELEDVIFQLIGIYINVLKNYAHELFISGYDDFFNFYDLNTSFGTAEIFSKIRETYFPNGLGPVDIARRGVSLVFENCYFESFKISGSVTCTSELYESVKLDNCVIHHAVFHVTHFSERKYLSLEANNTIFDNVWLRGGAHQSFVNPFKFEGCHFKFYTLTQYKCVFDDVLVFRNCTFCAGGGDMEICRVSFNNTKFNNSTEFVGCDFYVVPKFHNAKLHSDTSFHLSNFYDQRSSSSPGDYRVLKTLMSELGADQDAVMFHALEMDSRRQTVLPKLSNLSHGEWFASVCSHFLKLFNDYGRNYWRPFAWLLGVFVFFQFLYFLPLELSCNGSHYSDAEVWEKSLCKGYNLHHITNDLYASVVYSAQRSFGPLGLIIDSGLISAKTGVTKLFSVFQLILSSIIWYLIIVQLRRQFKL